MEPPAPRRRLVYLIILLALAAAAAVGVAIFRQLAETPLHRMVRADLPMLDLVVKLRDLNGNDLSPADTRIGDSAEIPAGNERCPALVGGDSSEHTRVSMDEKRPADCPKLSTWYVKRHPVAFTLYIWDGEALLDWYDKTPQVRQWLSSRFVQGLLYGFLQSLKVKGEDLKLQGLQGEFMLSLLRDAIAASAQLHYDMVHGKQGWVLSFVRKDSRFAAKALPAMAGVLARNGFRAARLEEPVLEMRVGVERFFLTQYRDRLYLANGLEALLNVIESLTPPSDRLSAPLTLTVRAEAFVDKLVPVMTGSPTWDANLSFTLKEDPLGSLSLARGPWDRQLHGKIFDGVLASIPHDAFAAVATSFRLSPTLTVEDWRRLATEGPREAAAGPPEESGFALVWDFDAAHSPTGAIGIIIANQTDPQATESYKQYLRNAELSSECAGGALFLAASSESLLDRMKEACAHRSLSPLDWERGREKQRFGSAQLMAFLNPGAGLRELFLAGGAAGDEGEDFAPQWKQEYLKAKAAMRADGEKLFAGLPILAYSGRSASGRTIRLEGHAVSQGVAP